MNTQVDIFACFVAALNDCLKKGAHGDKGKLAQAVGVTTGYISHLLAGRRQGPENIRRNIAAALGYNYDEFLSRGYALLSGHELDGHAHAFTYTGENNFTQRKQLLGAADKAQPRVSVVNAVWNAPIVPVYRDEQVGSDWRDSFSLPQPLLDKLAELDKEGLQKLEAWLDGYLARETSA